MLNSDRAEEYRRNRDPVDKEIEERLRADLRNRGDFKAVHVIPASGQDVQDDHDARLVVLGPNYPHAREQEADSRAVSAAKAIWEFRGSTPRLFRNGLAFLAPDQARLQDLEDAVRHYLAWQSILNDREGLDLPPHQVRQAENRKVESDNLVKGRIGESYLWLLAPGQSSPTDALKWESIRLTAQGPLAERASKRMRNGELLVTSFAGTRLRMELDRVPLRRGNHVSIGQLTEDFSRYSYLPRLRDPAVLLQAVANGLSLLTWEQDTFAYAESYDEESGRYRGLRAGQTFSINEGDGGLVVRPEVARRQMDAEVTEVQETEVGPPIAVAVDQVMPVQIVDVIREDISTPPMARRYHGSVKLNPTRFGRDASAIADEVIAHLSGLLGANVTITMEIKTEIPDGAPDNVIRIVTENSRTLRFEDSGFESG